MNELSDIGKQIETIFLQKKEKYPDVKVYAGTFGIKFDEFNSVVPKKDCVCPLGMVILGETLHTSNFLTEGPIPLLLQMLPNVTAGYFTGFWRGIDNENGVETTLEDLNLGYTDGTVFRDKYQITKRKKI